MARYSVQPGNQIFVKVYWFFPFAKNMIKNISKNLSGKYSQKTRNYWWTEIKIKYSQNLKKMNKSVG